MTKQYDPEVLFPDDLLVSYANKLLENIDSKFSVTRVKARGEFFIQFAAEGARGAKLDIVAPFGTFKTGLLFFRSLLKVNPNAPQANWLINGQSNKGTSEITFYGENGPVLSSTLDNVRAYFETVYMSSNEIPEKTVKYVEERIADVTKEGFVGEAPQIINWSDGERTDTPLGETPTQKM